MTSKLKTIVAAVVALLVLALVAGWIAMSVKGNKKPSSSDADTTGDNPAVEAPFYDNGIVLDGNGNVMKAGTVYSMPREIVFYTNTSGLSSVKVKASIKPSNADDKRVTWESDYPEIVSVTADSSDTLTATITKRATLTFGSVTITCRSVDNPSAYAQCKVDQLIDSTALELMGSINGNPSELVFGNSYTVSAEWTDTSPGVGTIRGNTENVYWGIYLTRDFMNKVDQYLAGTGHSLSGYEYDFDTSGVTGTLYATPYECFYGGDCDSGTFNNAFKLAMRDMDVHANLTIWADYTYNGRTYHSGKVDIPIKFSQSGIWIGVDDVELDQDSVLFS